MESTRFEFFLALSVCILCLSLSSTTSKSIAPDDESGYKIGTVYKYDIIACNFVTNNLTAHKAGFGRAVKANLYIKPLSGDEWAGSIQDLRTKDLKSEPEARQCASVPSDEHNFHTLSAGREPYLKINLRDGTVSRLNGSDQSGDAEKLPESSRWLKFFVRVLRLDLKGEHCEDPASCQLPTPEKPDVVFKTMETYLEDRTNIEVCETEYKVTALLNVSLETSSEPPIHPGNQRFFEVERTADYKKCLERFNDTRKTEADNLISGKFFNSAVIVGNITDYIVRSSVVTSWNEALTEKGALEEEAYVYNFNLTSILPANH